MTSTPAHPGKPIIDIRRWIVVVFLGCWLISPFFTLLQSDPEGSLPPCCRRDGKHHCAMNMAPLGPREGFFGPVKRCALFPKPFARAAGTHSVLNIAIHQWSPTVASTAATSTRPVLATGITTLRSHLKRAPPSASS